MFPFGDDVAGFSYKTNASLARAKEAVACWLENGLSEPPGAPPSVAELQAFRRGMSDVRKWLKGACLPGTGFAYIMFQADKPGNISFLTSAAPESVRVLFERWLKPGAMIDVLLDREGKA